MAIKVPKKWKENKEFVARVIALTADPRAGFRYTLNRAILNKDKGVIENLVQKVHPARLDQMLVNLKHQIEGQRGVMNKSFTASEIVSKAASGEGLKNASGIIDALSALSPLEGFLDDQGQALLDKAKKEVSRVLNNLGGNKRDFQKIAFPTSEAEALSPAAIKIRDAIGTEVQTSRELLDAESDLRHGRDLSPSVLRTLKDNFIDPESPNALEAIQRKLRSVEGLEEARVGSIDKSKQRKERFAEREDQMERVSLRQVEDQTLRTGREEIKVDAFEISRQAGIDTVRGQQILNNITDYIKKTGASFDEARNWALRGKPSGTPEHNVVNSLVDALQGAAQRTIEAFPELGRSPIAELQTREQAFDQSIDELAGAFAQFLPEDKDPMTLTDEELKQIADRARVEVGEQFDRTLNRAKEDLNLAKRFARENLETIVTQAESDLQRGVQRINRDTLRTLKEQVLPTLAERGLTRGGRRMVAEERLEEARRERVGDIERAAQRELQPRITTFAREFGTGELPRIPGDITDIGVRRPVEKGVRKLEQERFLSDLERKRKEAVERRTEEVAGLRSVIRRSTI